MTFLPRSYYATKEDKLSLSLDFLTAKRRDQGLSLRFLTTHDKKRNHHCHTLTTSPSTLHPPPSCYGSCGEHSHDKNFTYDKVPSPTPQKISRLFLLYNDAIRVVIFHTSTSLTLSLSRRVNARGVRNDLHGPC